MNKFREVIVWINSGSRARRIFAWILLRAALVCALVIVSLCGAKVYVVWVRHQAVAGDTAAMFKLAHWHYFGNQLIHRDEKQGVGWYRRAAMGGHVESMIELAGIYGGSLNTPKENAEAVMWLNRAAAAGSTRAMTRLGFDYSMGYSGVPKDDAKAALWYIRAAYAGDDYAMYEVGAMYERGLGGLPTDPAQAVSWYCKVPGVTGTFPARSDEDSELVRFAQGEDAHDALERLGINPKLACAK